MTKDFARYKNHKSFKKQAGQILIIFLLVLVVGLALVLSVASRSITDIRLTTASDESNRAYFAAEAGVEEALKQLQKDASYEGGELDFTAINQTTAKVNVSLLTSPTGTAAFLFPKKYDRDSVIQVSLMTDFNTLSSGPAVAGDELAIYYGDGSGTKKPAIEVSIVHVDLNDVSDPSDDVWGIKKFAYDGDGSRSGNNFCNPAGSTDVLIQSGDTKNFDYSAIVPFMDGYSSVCTGSTATLDGVLDAGAGHFPVLARIRFLYNDSPQPIAVGTNGTFPLPVQGTEVISTGSTVSGVTRKLKVTQLFPFLPSIFDYVLFSGGDLKK